MTSIYRITAGGIGVIPGLASILSSAAIGMIADPRVIHPLENNHAAMLIIDPESDRIFDANPAAIKVYGWPLSLMKNMHISDINTLTPDEIQIEMQNSVLEKRSHCPAAFICC